MQCCIQIAQKTRRRVRLRRKKQLRQRKLPVVVPSVKYNEIYNLLSLYKIVANDDAVPENFFVAVPLRRVADDIHLPSGTHPKYDFEANLWQKGVNSV